ncbi:recombinase RecT [Hahella ganghwensis]|uniref:recombinase RecT n=1 Tax=Hahella ganghwensis TaxID=286420 RepID=UPI00037CD67D|nr:recombinase RecT [Hahella ganghwensis]
MATQLSELKQPGGNNPLATLNHYFTAHKGQLAAALPKHLNPDRMARLAMTCFSQSKDLALCNPKSIFSSIVVASQLGLEPGVDGQAYLVPYKGTCTLVPGWKGYVDLVSRSGRGTVWTGAVFQGDQFDYQLGDSPYVRHKPGDENDESMLTHVYAIGRVKGAEWPIIEVWSVNKVVKHRDKHNKVGGKHYSYKNFEMYARKVPLMQVLKYMPKSVELTAAMEIDTAATEGRGSEYINGEFVILDNEPPEAEPAESAPSPNNPSPSDRKDSSGAAPEQAERDAQPAATETVAKPGKMTTKHLMGDIE